jgi:hypothetical protein
VRVSLGGRKAPDWLQAEDILVLARGSRFAAVCLDQPPEPAVCGPVFFHLRVKRPDIDAAFVAWQINQPPCQRQLLQGAAGSQQLNIRRPVLEALNLAVPSLPRQRALVAFAEHSRQERRALLNLIDNRERHEQALAEALHTAASASATPPPQDPT